MNWIVEYQNRVHEELKLNKRTPEGKKMIHIKIYDLLDESQLGKTLFYKIVFILNKEIDKDIVLFLK